MQKKYRINPAGPAAFIRRSLLWGVLTGVLCIGLPILLLSACPQAEELLGTDAIEEDDMVDGDPAAEDDSTEPEEPAEEEEPAEPEEDAAEELVSIAITSPPEKLVYARGEELDLRGLEIRGTYADGTSRIEEVRPEHISGYDKTQAASQTITITMNEKTAGFTITVCVTGLYADIGWPEEGNVIITGFSGKEIRCSASGNGGLARKFTLGIEGYRLIECWVDDKKIKKSAEGFVINAADYPVKEYTITCIGVKDGIPFLMEFPFVVVE
jgi:hypothetical protein